MRLSCILFIIISRVCIGAESISNGTFISIEEAPFYVSITLFNRSFCGGSIISEYWIISAAHCFFNFNNRWIGIRSGSSTDGETARKHEIEKIIISEDYNYNLLEVGTTTGTHDISLIKLKEPIMFNKFQQPIKVSQDSPKDGEKSIIYGLGHQGGPRAGTLVLKMVEVDIISQEECQSKLKSELYVTNGVFCTGDPDGITNTNACNGDSGGPVVIDGRLVGIVSVGFPCQTSFSKGNPVFHTRIHKHYDWIIKHTGITY